MIEPTSTIANMGFAFWWSLGDIFYGLLAIMFLAIVFYSLHYFITKR
jgi:predicted PurR-regulated permease PerM